MNVGLKELRENYKDEILALYSSGISMYKIGKMLKTHDANIKVILKENNVKLRVKKKNNRYNYNEHYFDDIDNQNKAYFLGLLYADGCNDYLYNRITIALETRDGYILEYFRKEIESEKKLYLTKPYKNTKEQLELVLIGDHISNVLLEKGVKRKKSLTLEWPNWLSEELYSHFIRGYFDGDGYISNPYKRKNPQVEIVSSDNFIIGLKEFLEKTKNIKGTIGTKENKHTLRLSFYTNKERQDVQRFFNYIYQDANFYLKRKKEFADFYLKNNIL